jgi:hypothetical protein
MRTGMKLMYPIGLRPWVMSVKYRSLLCAFPYRVQITKGSYFGTPRHGQHISWAAS